MVPVRISSRLASRSCMGRVKHMKGTEDGLQYCRSRTRLMAKGGSGSKDRSLVNVVLDHLTRYGPGETYGIRATAILADRPPTERSSSEVNRRMTNVRATASSTVVCY
jgi:hypothetical protein